MPRDHIVDETRRIREDLAKAHDYDIKKIVRTLQREETKTGRKLVTLPPRLLTKKKAG